MIHHTRRLMAAFAILLIGAVPLRAADDPQKVMMVLDASGSMWGQIDGTAKIEIARTVIDGLLTDWDSSVEMGLIAYGHRQKGDCNDIETLAPVGAVDKAAFMAKVKSLNPKGKTPITTSVRQAADQLKYTEEKATVILISDGLETCDADPCQLASELEAKGVDFTTHVVGFDLSEEESKSLQCIADNTGGKFLNASNAAELTTALAETVQVVKEEPAGPQGLRLRAKLCEDCDILTDDKVFWWVYKPEQDLQGKREELKRTGAAAPVVELPVGDYYVVGRYGNGSVYRNVDASVTEGELTDVVVNMDAGALRLSGIPTAGAEPLDDDVFYWVFGQDKDLEGKRKEFDRSGSANPIIWLMADSYLVRARHGKAFAEADLTVEAGKVKDHTFDLNVGYLRVSAIPTAGADVLKEKMFYWVLSTTKNLDGKRTEIDRAGLVNPLFRLPAGTYLLRARHGKAFAEKDITVAAGALTEEQMDMNVGYLKPAAIMTEGGAPLTSKMFYWVLSPTKDLNGKQAEIDRAGNANPVFRLSAGDYVLRARHGKAIVEQAATVTAGALNDPTLVMNSAIVRLAATQQEGGAEIGSGLFWWLYQKTDEGKGTEIERAGRANPVMIVPAGDYIASVRLNGVITDTPLTLVAGEEKAVSVVISGE